MHMLETIIIIFEKYCIFLRVNVIIRLKVDLIVILYLTPKLKKYVKDCKKKF